MENRTRFLKRRVNSLTTRIHDHHPLQIQITTHTPATTPDERSTSEQQICQMCRRVLCAGQYRAATQGDKTCLNCMQWNSHQLARTCSMDARQILSRRDWCAAACCLCRYQRQAKLPKDKRSRTVFQVEQGMMRCKRILRSVCTELFRLNPLHHSVETVNIGVEPMYFVRGVA